MVAAARRRRVKIHNRMLIPDVKLKGHHESSSTCFKSSATLIPKWLLVAVSAPKTPWGVTPAQDTRSERVLEKANGNHSPHIYSSKVIAIFSSISITNFHFLHFQLLLPVHPFSHKGSKVSEESTLSKCLCIPAMFGLWDSFTRSEEDSCSSTGEDTVQMQRGSTPLARRTRKRRIMRWVYRKIAIDECEYSKHDTLRWRSIDEASAEESKKDVCKDVLDDDIEEK
ncbi:hypothetical protein Tco_0689150 [Tanacetum coccineum]